MGKFTKRTGTTNKGTEYEILNIANVVLNLISNEQVQNFQVSSNDLDYGNFDDIVVEIESSSGKETYALQLKYSGKKSLNEEKLKQSRDFSIKKYFDSFTSIKKDVKNLILFTTLNFSGNLDFQLEDETLTVKSIKVNDPIDFINTSRKKDCCYKFEVVDLKNTPKVQLYQEFFSKFLLYVSQQDVKPLKTKIEESFKAKYNSNEFDKFLKVISEWSKAAGKKEKLDKKWMQRAIAIHVLSPYVKSLSFGDVADNMKILRRAISAFKITVLEEDSYARVKCLWDSIKNEPNELKELNRIRSKFQLDSSGIKNIGEVEPKLISQLLWLMGRCPLMVEDNQTARKALKLCQKEKFILLTGEFVEEELGQVPFQNLSQLSKKSKCYKDILKNFTCSIQGKEAITLEMLAKEGEEFQKFVRIDDLLKMVKAPLKIGGDKEDLPIPYIHRSIQRNVISMRYLEEVKNDVLVVIDSVKDVDLLRKKFDKCNFIDINQKDKKSSCDQETGRRILFSKCDKTKFEEISSHYKNYHHFRLQTGDSMEWIRSEGDLHQFKDFKIQSFIPEKNLFQHFENNINLVIGDPGMGKSELLKNLKNNSKTNIWVVLLSSSDVKSFFQKKTEFEDFLIDVKYKNLDRCSKEMFKIFLSQNEVVFVWDALDEVSEHLNSVTNLILELSKKHINWITSRSHLKQSLETKFNVLSLSINQFDKEEQEFYIKERLKTLDSEEVIKKINSAFEFTTHKEILGIPLQLFMLTELFCRNSEKYLELLNDTFVLTDLYYHFVEEKFNIYYVEKNESLDFNNPRLRAIFEHYNQKLFFNHQLMALRVLLPEDIVKLLDLKDISFDVDENISIGLITEVVNDIPHFLHISFVEYLVAVYFAENLNHTKIFSTIIFEEQFNNVRFFFDLILAGKSLPHIAVLYRNNEMLRSCPDSLLKEDRGGRSPLHLSCSWGFRLPLIKVQTYQKIHVIDESEQNFPDVDENSKLLSFLLEKCDHSKPDTLFEMTPLCYAEKCNNIEAQVKILRKDETKLSESKKCINFLYYSAVFGWEEALELQKDLPVIKTKKRRNSLIHLSVKHPNYIAKMLNSNKNIINEKNNEGDTPLHVACSVNNETVTLLLENGADPDSRNKNEETPLYLACLHGAKNNVEVLIQRGVKINAGDVFNTRPLHRACEKGHLEIVEKLVENGGEVDASNQLNSTPLMKACESGHYAIAEFLVSKNCEIDVADGNGETAFHIACENGREDIVEFLFDKGARIDVENNFKCTPLHSAAERGHLNIVEFLVSKGAKIDAIDKYKWTALHRACKKGHCEIVEYLLQNGATPTISDIVKSTPLHSASRAGYENIVKYLITTDVEVNARDEYGYTPLHRASEMGHHEVVQILLTKNDIKIDAADIHLYTALHRAVEFGYEKIVDCLVRRGAGINKKDEHGYTALHRASSLGHRKVVECLVKNGADINEKDKFKYTPLHRAVDPAIEKFSASLNYFIPHRVSHKDRLKIVQFLLSKGADVKSFNIFNYSPLHSAAYVGNNEMVECLLSNGVDVDILNKIRRTPLYVACMEGRISTVEFLVLKGASVNVTDEQGFSPLHQAAQRGDLKIVEFLVGKGANIDARTEKGLTPIELATRKRHSNVVNFLRSLLE